MAVQHPVATERIREIVEASAMRNSPLALTFQINGAWQNFRSRFLGMRDDQVWIEYPQGFTGNRVSDMRVGQKVGISFKQRHHKYVFSTAIRSAARMQLDPVTRLEGLCIAWPARMFQLQRRVFQRMDVPHDMQVFVDFWEGGLAHEPDGDLREKLLYHGQLVDLSAGGFQVRLIGDSDPRFRAGASLGASFLIGGSEDPICVDALFRHVNPDEFGTTLGMQIVGLNETPRGRKTLERIGDLLRQFARGTRNSSEPPRVHVGC